MEIPPYLAANTTTTTPTFDVAKITNFDYDYSYQNVPEKLSTKTFWEDLADTTDQTISKANTAVWDTASGAWQSAKSGLADAAHAAGSLVSDATSAAGGLFDSLLLRILLVFAALILGLWILGKSGVLSTIAGAVKP